MTNKIFKKLKYHKITKNNAYRTAPLIQPCRRYPLTRIVSESGLWHKLALKPFFIWNNTGTGHHWTKNSLVGNKQCRAVDSIKHCVKRLPQLKWTELETSEDRIRDLRALECKASWKYTTCATRVVFLPLFSRKLQIFTSLLFCWATPSENTGLWQLPNVSSAFTLWDTYDYYSK